jgi:hypothetical protein
MLENNRECGILSLMEREEITKCYFAFQDDDGTVLRIGQCKIESLNLLINDMPDLSARYREATAAEVLEYKLTTNELWNL